MTTRKRPRRPVQLTLDSARRPTGRGGWRPGAGRPRGPSTVGHVRRAGFAKTCPQHVTLRIRDGVGSLRRGRALGVVRRAICAGGHGDSFRVVHFSLLSNHMHLVVEAAGAAALARGMQGLAVRLARGLNSVLGRKGKLFAQRYHARTLSTPREVRNVLRYVLCNRRHHAAEHGQRLATGWLDPYSSGAWFEGWRQPLVPREPWERELVAEPAPTAPPRVWLLTTGWKRWGLLDLDETPGQSVRR